MTSASSLITHLVSNYPSCCKQLSSWIRYKEKKILFEAIREYPKKRGLEVLRSWREKIGTEESPVLCTGCPPRYLPIPKMYICRVKFVKLNLKYLLGRDFGSFTVLGR